jgi:hypothetical protein
MTAQEAFLSRTVSYQIDRRAASDQRGYSRFGRCDSGAFELGGAAPTGGGGTPSGAATTPSATTSSTQATTVSSSGIASTPQAIEELLLGLRQAVIGAE